MNNEEEFFEGVVAREVMTSVADRYATDPPFELRSRLLDEALLCRPSMNASSPHSNCRDVYRRSVITLDALLNTLSDDSWRVLVVNGWNVRDVIVHLFTVDDIATATLRNEEVFATADDIEILTSNAVAKTGTSTEARDQWFRQSQLLLDAFDAYDADSVSYLGIELAPEMVLGDRAFETWLHTQDIRVAMGQPVESPIPSDLSMLTDLGARMLAKVAGESSLDEHQNVRLVLDGKGGGSWIVPLHESEMEPTTTLTLDPIDFCLLVGDRLSVEDLQFTVSGDARMADVVLRLASELSRV